MSNLPKLPFDVKLDKRARIGYLSLAQAFIESHMRDAPSHVALGVDVLLAHRVGELFLAEIEASNEQNSIKDEQRERLVAWFIRALNDSGPQKAGDAEWYADQFLAGKSVLEAEESERA